MTLQRSGFVALLSLAICAAGPWASAQSAAPVTPVTVVAAKIVKMAPTIAMPGTVVARNDSHIGAQVEGNVTWVANVGDVVKQNDILAKLDNNLLTMQDQSDAANVAHLKAVVRFDDLQAMRMMKLARSNAVATSTRDEAVSTRDSDKAQLNQAVAELAKTKYQLDHCDIRAPFPGRVAARFINAGEYATVGKDIVRLVDIDDIEISTPAPIATSHYLNAGTPVTMDVEGKIVVAKVRAVVPVGDINSRTVEVRLVIAASDGIVGDAAKVFIPAAAPRDVLAVPRDAVLLREDNTYVFRINAKNVAERVAIETGTESGSLVEIRGGLAAGDRVVIRGGERLEAGQSVKPVLVASAPQ